LKESQEVLALARKLGHPFSLADVLCYAGCLVNEMRRDGEALKERAEELKRLAKDKVPIWSDAGIDFGGEALVLMGQVEKGMAQMREGIAAYESRGLRFFLSGRLGRLAEAQSRAGHPNEALNTLDEALALVEDTGERQWEAELHRVRGELLLAQGNEEEGEAGFHRAIQVARRQQGRSWELRATVSLCRLWQQQGRLEEARQRLVAIHSWFTEGFDTADLIEARTLLEELAP
jgi:predicted ATPase